MIINIKKAKSIIKNPTDNVNLKNLQVTKIRDQIYVNENVDELANAIGKNFDIAFTSKFLRKILQYTKGLTTKLRKFKFKKSTMVITFLFSCFIYFC